MKSIIEKLAYKFCSTEVKMLIDKLEADPKAVLARRTPIYLNGYVAIVDDGLYSFRDRVAIATAVRRIRQQATKTRIVELIFEGEQKQGQYIPGETITQRKTNPNSILTTNDITREALKIIENEMSNVYKTPTQTAEAMTAEAMRQKGLL
jgi:hypothetical protein